MTVTVAIPKQRCPHCGYYMKVATMVSAKHNDARPGDVTLCINCMEVFRFNDEMRLKRATKREMKWIMQLHGDHIISLQNIARFLRRKMG